MHKLQRFVDAQAAVYAAHRVLGARLRQCMTLLLFGQILQRFFRDQADQRTLALPRGSRTGAVA